MAKVQTKVKRKIKKDIKKNPMVFALAIIFLILGLIAGGCACYYVTKDDSFELIGDKEITITIGEEYVDLGAVAKAFGKDVSQDIKVESEVDITTAGTYAVIYTCESIRFKDIKRIRYVTVVEGVE